MAGEIVLGLLGPAIELAKCVVPPIRRQLNYLCCFNSNIESLRNEAQKLDGARAGLQLQVDRARDNVELILPAVETWLTGAKEQQDEISKIEDEIRKVPKHLLHMKSRFSLSRKAKKMIPVVKEQWETRSKFSPISMPPPPQARVLIPLEPTHEFQSQKQIEDDAMNALRGKKFNMIGICGMGGVGKTIMAKRIRNKVLKEKLFDAAVMVAVGQHVDMLKIQRQITEQLGLTMDDETLQARAHRLRSRLRGAERILIVLDDIWEELKLEEVGIPCETGFQGCTLLVTSRDREVLLNRMDAQVFEMKVLSEEEAWSLFTQKAGISTDDDDGELLSIAKEIADECKGLPIALVTLGSALKGQQGKDFIWVDTRDQLKFSEPPLDYEKGVYIPLKLSYDYLQTEDAKSLFLLCCLFPEDWDIGLHDLTVYTMGLGMFKRINTLKKAADRVFRVIDQLKSRFLLLDGKDKYHVRIHDVIRDVAIFIALEKRLADVNLSSTDCRWISVFSENTLSLFRSFKRPNFPNLLLLRIRLTGPRTFQISEFQDIGVSECVEISPFKGMEKLNVLSLHRIRFTSQPESMQLPKNLRTIYLEHCNVENISVLGELLSLEILCCRHCESIVELPYEIGELYQLKLLEFTDCFNLKRIVPGVISKLVKLEELKMIRSFRKWESAEDNGRSNASLSEVQSLTNLIFLEIEIENWTAAEEMGLSKNIVKYVIAFTGRTVRSSHLLESFCWFCNEKVEFDILEELRRKEFIWHDRILSDFFNRLQELHVDCCGKIRYLFSSPIAENLVNLKVLRIQDCEEMEKVILDEKNKSEESLLFPSLERLELDCLPKLGVFCEWSCVVKLPSLRIVRIKNCPLMKAFTMGSPTAPNLEEICIDRTKKDVGDLNDVIQLCLKSKEWHLRDQLQDETEER